MASSLVIVLVMGSLSGTAPANGHVVASAPRLIDLAAAFLRPAGGAARTETLPAAAGEPEPAASTAKKLGPSLLLVSGAALAIVGAITLVASGSCFAVWGVTYSEMAAETAGSARYKQLYDQSYVSWNLALPLALVGIAASTAGVGLILLDLFRPKTE